LAAGPDLAHRRDVVPVLDAAPDELERLAEREWAAEAHVQRLRHAADPDRARAHRHELVREHRGDAAVREAGRAGEALRERGRPANLTAVELQPHVGPDGTARTDDRV